MIGDSVFQRGDPVVLCGGDLLDRPIRWLHSGDIYEIASLLRDGDVLLTTGLGLAERTETERRAYVRQLADRGVSGVVLELRRFFMTAPPEMLDEAEHVGLPIIGFRALVPFVEVIEAVNSVIIDVTVHRLRLTDHVSRALSEVLADGGKVGELLVRLSAILDRPIALNGPSGERLIDAGSGPEGSETEQDLPVRTPVVVNGAVWGWLLTSFTDYDSSVGQAALERAAEIVALGLLRGGWGAMSRSANHYRLISALLSGEGEREGLRIRASAAGLPLNAAGYIVALVRDDDPAEALATLDRSARAAYATTHRDSGRYKPTPTITAEAEGICCTLLATAVSPRQMAARLAAELADTLTATGVAAVGPPVRTVEELVHCMAEARLVLGVARQVAPRTHVAEAAKLGVERALLRAYGVDGLARYVHEKLGPLIDSDDQHGTRLIDTLDVVLTSAEGKTEAARRLHLRRQTLYQRLQRIAQLLDADLAEPCTRADLLVALRARHLLGNDPVSRSVGVSANQKEVNSEHGPVEKPA
ncbi:PucR family transcriptional regulator [Nonomuraea recticatena]